MGRSYAKYFKLAAENEITRFLPLFFEYIYDRMSIDKHLLEGTVHINKRRMLMGKKDIVLKEYMQDKEVFADAFNYLIYQGRNVVKPELLSDLNVELTGIPYGNEGMAEYVQKYRDNMRLYSAMEDGKMTYVIFGLENQVKVHYAMPIRNMIYDALQYGKQVSDKVKKHRKRKKQKPVSNVEFLSGLSKKDRLTPVMTLVIHFGAEHWDGPLSLHEMLDFPDEESKTLIPDYRINLIEPSIMEEEDLNRLHSSLREVLKYIKYSKDKKLLDQAVLGDSRFQMLDWNTANVINVVTESKFQIEEGKERFDMCEAIRGMMQDAKEEKAKEVALKMKDKGMSVEAIAEIVDYPIEMVKGWLSE